MQRVTITLDDDLVAEIDQVAIARGYQNRSEVIRDLARAGLAQMAQDANSSRDCVAALVYVYDHEARELPKRLTQAFHNHHALSLAAMHIHLDHEICMEVSVLQGRAVDVKHFSDHVIAERGVRHGHLIMIPFENKSEGGAQMTGSGYSHGRRRVRKSE